MGRGRAGEVEAGEAEGYSRLEAKGHLINAQTSWLATTYATLPSSTFSATSGGFPFCRHEV